MNKERKKERKKKKRGRERGREERKKKRKEKKKEKKPLKYNLLINERCRDVLGQGKAGQMVESKEMVLRWWRKNGPWSSPFSTGC